MEKEQTQDSAQKERNEENTEIREMGTLDLGNGHSKHGIQLLTIIGEIEGHEAVSGNTKATKYGCITHRMRGHTENTLQCRRLPQVSSSAHPTPVGC